MVKKIPVIYGPTGDIVSAGGVHFKKDAASRSGSLSGWNPGQIFDESSLSREREDIVARSINLVNDDPNAAGIIDNFCTTVIGAGLRPMPALNADALGITKKEAKILAAKQKAIYAAWAPEADAAGRMSDGEVQHLKARCLFGMGESLELVHMKKGADRSYRLCTQVINPLRLKTPTDKVSSGKIRDGIECGKYGEPEFYWIKKACGYLSDTSENFVRIPAKKGHRFLVLHDFVTKDPEQVRGYPLLSPAMRFFRNFSDLLGAELTSNVVTAALSVFVESADPYAAANSQLQYGASGTATAADRQQEINPGEIWYGTAGQKPHLLSADRPGSTFEPFTKLIKKSISMATGIPFSVAFKDLDGVSFAGYRSAMLEAWRVYNYHRQRIGSGDCQKKYDMLMEEAAIIGELDIPDFYDNMRKNTACNWYGAPKGDIEPYKAIKSDIEKWGSNVKTLEQIIIEDGGPGLAEVADKIEDERNLLLDKKLVEPKEGGVDSGQ